MKAIISKSIVKNVAFIDLNSPEPGGAIFDSVSENKSIEVCEFVDVRTVSDNGGAIWKENGMLTISKCCFERCRSGNKANNLGGNVLWYCEAGAAIDLCLVFRSSDEEIPGDSAIVSYPANSCDVENVNFTRNDGFAKSNYYGNCVLEVDLMKIGSFKYSNVVDSKGFRIIALDKTPNSLFSHSNVVNCTVKHFTVTQIRIRNCCIFNNIFEVSKTYDVQDCLSDNLLFCTSQTKMTLMDNKYGEKALCEK